MLSLVNNQMGGLLEHLEHIESLLVAKYREKYDQGNAKQEKIEGHVSSPQVDSSPQFVDSQDMGPLGDSNLACKYETLQNI